MLRSPAKTAAGCRQAASPARRRFLQLAGAAPVLLSGVVSGAAWLSGCGSGEEAAKNPYAGETAPEVPDVPDPATTAPAPKAEAGGDAAPAGDGASQGGSNALVTEVPAARATVEALQYTNQSEKPDQRCAGCQFYTARTNSRGACQLFPQGLVSAQGWCSSWTAKVTT